MCKKMFENSVITTNLFGIQRISKQFIHISLSYLTFIMTNYFFKLFVIIEKNNNVQKLN